MAASLAYVPFPLSDEQYAAILRAPQAHGYSVNAHPPAAHAGSVGMFGALYLFKEDFCVNSQRLRNAGSSAANLVLLEISGQCP